MSDLILLEDAHRAAEVLISDLKFYMKIKHFTNLASMRVVRIGEFAKAAHYPEMTSISKLQLMIQASIGKEKINFCLCLRELLSLKGHRYRKKPFAVNIGQKSKRKAKWISVDLVPSEKGPFLPSAAASMRDVDPKNVPAASIAELIGLKLYYRPQKSRSKQTSCTGPRPSRQEVKEAENMVEKNRPVFVTPHVRQSIDSGLAYAQKYSHRGLEWWDRSFFVVPMVDDDSFTKGREGRPSLYTKRAYARWSFILPRRRAHTRRVRSVRKARKPLYIHNYMHQRVPDTADVGTGRLQSAAATSDVPPNTPNAISINTLQHLAGSPLDGSPRQSTSSDAAAGPPSTDTNATTRSTLANPIGRHLFICISTRTGDTLKQIDMAPIGSDEGLFRCINQQYLEVKQAETRLPQFFFRRLFWSLHRPNEMNYISFQPLHLCDAVYPTHIRSPSLPPESEMEAKRWEYSPSSRDPEGWTIPGYLLPRVLQHGPSTPGSLWIDAIPKKLGQKLDYGKHPRDEDIV